MNKDNKALLEQLINDRLNKAMQEGENATAFEEAMKAIDRQLLIDNREFELAKEEMKQEYDAKKESSKQQFEMNRDEKKYEHELNRDVNKQDFEAMQADETRKHELNRDKRNHEFEMTKLETEQALELKKLDTEGKRQTIDRLMKVVEIGATVVAAPLIEAGCKKAFAHMLCEFEKDYNFTTMAGKSLSGIFKFRK